MLNAFFCLLPHECIMSVTGVDSKKFLQGQLTCNLDYISPSDSSLSACCTSKGRMISSFRIVEVETNHYLLALDKNLFEKQYNEFKKYAIFSKVVFEEASQCWYRVGLEAAPHNLSFLNMSIPEQNNQVSSKDQQLLIKVSENRFELWIQSSQSQQVLEVLNKNMTEQSLNNWLLGQIQAGIGQVFFETTEKFVPQMINLQSLGGVSFRKGCYIGQEIVARMQYLGKLKQHLYRFTANFKELPCVGTALYSNVHPTSVGEVVLSAATADNKIELLAIVRDDAAIAQLWLEEKPDLLLAPLPLPYSINYDEEIKQ